MIIDRACTDNIVLMNTKETPSLVNTLFKEFPLYNLKYTRVLHSTCSYKQKKCTEIQTHIIFSLSSELVLYLDGREVIREEEVEAGRVDVQHLILGLGVNMASIYAFSGQITQVCDV